MLAHRLGDNLSLDEGNLLRKVLTKKGTGKGAQAKQKLHDKFLTGCVAKGMTRSDAEQLWKTLNTSLAMDSIRATQLATVS